MQKMMRVLDTADDRNHFKADLAGKRILHVKGFGSGFGYATPTQAELEAKQQREAVVAMSMFGPHFLVVDGDPWGVGFQRHIKAFIDWKRQSGGPLPQLIWAKNVKMSEGSPSDAGERSKRVKQAEQWMEQCTICVIVYWIDNAWIGAKMDALYGEGTVAKLEPEKFSTRGLVSITTGDMPPWVAGLGTDIWESVKAMEDPIRQDQQCFEKCSFENSAKGNAIFEALDLPDLAAHGVACLGGGESVVLELATKYLNSKSGFDMRNAAVFPHSRGREAADPRLPEHLGEAFCQGSDPALPQMDVASRTAAGWWTLWQCCLRRNRARVGRP